MVRIETELHVKWAVDTEPTLRTAQNRVVDAATRIDQVAEVFADMDAYARANPPRVTFPAEKRFDHPDTIETVVDWRGTHSVKHFRAARPLVSEAIHHLRTALEYLAFQLVWLDTGSQFERSAFPLCKKSSDWPGALKRQVPGLTPRHQGVLKGVQPFKHCRWTTRLQELSNQDKHRQVLLVNTTLGGEFNWDPREARPDPDDPSRWRIDVVPSESLRVELVGGGDAVETLKWIAREVAALLDSLVADFGGTHKLIQ